MLRYRSGGRAGLSRYESANPRQMEFRFRAFVRRLRPFRFKPEGRANRWEKCTGYRLGEISSSELPHVGRCAARHIDRRLLRIEAVATQTAAFLFHRLLRDQCELSQVVIIERALGLGGLIWSECSGGSADGCRDPETVIRKACADCRPDYCPVGIATRQAVSCPDSARVRQACPKTAFSGKHSYASTSTWG